MELEIRGLTKSYGSKLALSDFSATFTPGVYALLGPNGAGKSTLINIIADNLKADAGEVLWNGRSAVRMGADFRRILGFMPQQQRLYDRFTGRQFLLYMAALKGLPAGAARAEADRVLALVNMTDQAGKRLGAYSGGMKQRILIAQACLGSPELLILDEPTAGLDPKERIRIRNLISVISSGIIVLIATHVVSDIEYISKEVLLLDRGRIIGAGSPAELCRSIEGRVFEVVCPAEELEKLSQKYTVGNIAHTSQGVRLCLLADTPPDGCECRPVFPSLEDVYLHLFGDERGV